MTVLAGHSWRGGPSYHMPLLINIANKRGSNGCCADCCDDRSAVMTWADTGDNAGLWHSHHLLTCTDDVLITLWSMSMIHVQSVYWEQKTSSELTDFSSEVSRMRTLFLGMLESYDQWGCLFPCDILRSKCREYVTFHVHCTGVQSACTPVQHLYTTVPGIHSVVRRPQRGQHQWTPLQESKWDLAFWWSLATQCFYNWQDQAVTQSNNNWESECDLK